MSLLRDGIHRRAPLTARFGSARFGAARFGCVYGQDDLATLTREIKDENLEGVGPFYVWAEALPIDTPFAGLTQYISTATIGGLVFTGTSTVSEVSSSSMLLGGSSAGYFDPASIGIIRFGGGDDTEGYTQDVGPAGQLTKQGPNPFGGPMRRLRSAKGY